MAAVHALLGFAGRLPLWLLRESLYASVVAVPILLFLRAFKHMHLRVQYAVLWLILARLFLPLDLSSPVSGYGWLMRLTVRQAIEAEPFTVSSVPPLDQSVRHSRVDRVGAQESGRHRQVVDDVEHRDRDHERHVEPDRDVYVFHLPNRDRAEEVDREHHPDQRHRHVDRPDQLGVLARLRDPQWVSDDCRHDDRLPAPEVDLGQRVAEHSRLQETLHRIVDAGEADVAGEGEDHGIGVQGTQSTEGRPGQPEVGGPPGELEGDDHPHEHAYNSPNRRREEEFSDDVVIIIDDARARRSGRCRYGAFHV